MAALAVLRPGDWVRFDGGEHEVLAVAGTSVRLRSAAGSHSVVLASYLMAAPDFAVTGGEPVPEVEPFGLLDSLPEDVLAAAREWERHVVEVQAGLPPDAAPDAAPRPEYDPATRILAAREQAKATELGGSVRTIQSRRARYARQGLWGLVDQRAVRSWEATGHDGQVAAVAVSADGRRAVTGSYYGTVRVWDLDTGEPLHTLAGHDGPVHVVAVTADGRRAVTIGGDDETVRVWDLDTGQQQAELNAGPVAAVAVTADGRRAVSVGRGTARVWDLDTGELLRTLADIIPRNYAVAVSADGRRAVTYGRGRIVRIWDLANGKQVASARQRLWNRFRAWSPAFKRRRWTSVYSVAFSSDGRRAVSGSEGGTVRVWDLDTGQQQAKLSGRVGPVRGVRAVAVSADGRRAVSGGWHDGTVRVWDLDTGQQRAELNTGRVAAVAVSADGRRAVSGSENGTVRVWDLEEGAELASFASDSKITEVAVTPAVRG